MVVRRLVGVPKFREIKKIISRNTKEMFLKNFALSQTLFHGVGWLFSGSRHPLGHMLLGSLALLERPKSARQAPRASTSSKFPIHKSSTGGSPRYAGAVLAGIPAPQAHFLPGSPSSYEEGDVKAMPAKRT
jgi:hypothetical protein